MATFKDRAVRLKFINEIIRKTGGELANTYWWQKSGRWVLGNDARLTIWFPCRGDEYTSHLKMESNGDNIAISKVAALFTNIQKVAHELLTGDYAAVEDHDSWKGLWG